MTASKRIALLGQPNSGKSTLFNTLTGSHQHVGNWPGKTVEQVEGEFRFNNQSVQIVDLPGTYSLSANSEEELITREFIGSGRADLVLIMADASQLERSLFMLADYAGINTPAILVLSLVDVANDMGKQVDTELLSQRLGIPVVSIVSPDPKTYDPLYQALEESFQSPKLVKAEGLFDLLRKGDQGAQFESILKSIPQEGVQQFSSLWLAEKLMEGDSEVQKLLSIPQEDTSRETEKGQREGDGRLYTSDVKFDWIAQGLEGAVEGQQEGSPHMSQFDRLALSPTWGKPLAIGIVLIGLILSMTIAAPFMGLGSQLPEWLDPLVQQLGAPDWLTSLMSSTVVAALGWVLSMVGFVFGITLVFGLIEEVGYMARVSYVFDNTMRRFGLQGKSVMPMVVSVGCTIGGAAGTRVIDSWGQRVLTIALAWAVPCGATFAVIPALATQFFGKSGALLVLLLIFVVMFLHIQLTARIFGRALTPPESRTGLIMELPPYHKPRWKNLLSHTWYKSVDVFKKAFVVVVSVAFVFWLLTYSQSGDPSGTVLYRVGQAIEPVTRWFGLGWQTFIAFLASMISKEAVLGVTSALFGGSGTLLGSTISGAVGANSGEILAHSIAKPEALAFIMAVTFNVPCVMALSATLHETHSLKWTARIAAYYIVSALVLSALTYHLSSLIF